MLNVNTPRPTSNALESSPAFDLLARTPIERLEETVRLLKVHRPEKEIRDAMLGRVSSAPLSEFETLKRIFFDHFPDWR